jgi:hypothetical protein
MAAAAISGWAYMIGTALLVPSTVLMLDTFAAFYTTAIWILILATALLTFAALVALVDGCRPCPCRIAGGDGVSALPLLASVDATAARELPPSAPSPRFWSLFNLWLMVQGGTLFLAASCLYRPDISNITLPHLGGTTVANLGTWVFRTGTLSYLGGSAISLVQIGQAPGAWVRVCAQRRALRCVASRAFERWACLYVPRVGVGMPASARIACWCSMDATAVALTNRGGGDDSVYRLIASLLAGEFRARVRVTIGVLLYTTGSLLYVLGGGHCNFLVAGSFFPPCRHFAPPATSVHRPLARVRLCEA